MIIAKKVELYIKLRDRREQRKKEYQEADEADKASQTKIEAMIMADFNAEGTESLKTEWGTAYRSSRTSITAADWDITLDFIKKNELWEMLEKRVTKTVVEEYIAENDEVPPGLNITTAHTINVRRS